MAETELTWVRGYRFGPFGITFERDLTDPEFLECGQRTASIINGSTWALGDWLVYGLGRGPKGDMYGQARKLTGRTYDSLVQLTKVAEAFPVGRRTAKVPWSHYREALRLPEGERLAFLERDEAAHWGRDQLSQQIERYLAAKRGRPVREVRGGNTSTRERRQADRRGEDAGRRATDDGPKTAGPRTNAAMCCPNCGHRWTARLQRDV